VPLGSVELVQVAPPLLLVEAMPLPLLSAPTAKQVDELAHDTALKLPYPFCAPP
jgi:hypothetical protein